MKRRVVRIGEKGKCKVTAREKELSSELDVRIAILPGGRQGFKLSYPWV